MKFQLAINMERMDDSRSMPEVARHTLEMVQMADQGGFTIAWAAEHHALEMTIAPQPVLDPHIVGRPYRPHPPWAGRGRLLAPDQAGR